MPYQMKPLHIDYGATAAAYIDVFMRNINWSHVAQCYQRAGNQSA
jgi:superoxide dismutase